MNSPAATERLLTPADGCVPYGMTVPPGKAGDGVVFASPVAAFRSYSGQDDGGQA